MRRFPAILVVLVVLGLAAPDLPGEGARAGQQLGFFAEEAPGPTVKTFALPLDGGEWTVNCHVAWWPETRKALIIDPGAPAPAIVDFIRQKRLDVLAILNTHGHRDHVGGIPFLDGAFPSLACFLHRADWELAVQTTGTTRPFSFYPGETLALGELEIAVIHVPGHSPGSVCLKIGDAVFSGDTLFAGAVGKPHGADDGERRANLRREIAGIRGKLLALPPETRVFPGHGPATTIGAQKRSNPHLR